MSRALCWGWVGLVVLAGASPAAEPLVLGPAVEFVRRNPYDVWQVYGVDNRGSFRPLVAPTPDGLRYVYNGVRYPWWQSYPHHFERVVTHQASFADPPAEPVIIQTTVVLPMPREQPWERMPYADE